MLSLGYDTSPDTVRHDSLFRTLLALPLIPRQSYDTDGSGELDEDEFVEVLMSAGWEQAEAHEVYSDVNTDGEGGVGLDEFEAWWKGLVLLDLKAKEQLRCDLTIPALNNNLERMAAYMARLGYDDHEAFFRASSLSIPSSVSKNGRSSHTMGLHLPVLEVNGDIFGILELVAEQTDEGDHKGACKQMYELLLSNTALLDIDPANLLIPDAVHAEQLPEVRAKRFKIRQC